MFNSLKKWFGKKGAEAPLDATSLACHPTLCMMPWVHLHVTQTGHVTPCCQAPWQAERAFGSVNESAVAEIWNGNAIKKFRKNMLAGKPDPRCQACYDKEKDGFRSLRHVTNQDYGHHVDLLQATAPSGHLPEAKPIYLDIRFSNICNFKCRICGPWSSSQWHNDALALGMKQPGKKAIDKSILQPEAFWPQIEELVPGLEEIYFAGGEPLMMEEHYHFLEMLHQQQKFDLTLKYNTNLSVLKLKSWDVIELWRPFKQVIIAASLDGSGRRGEYQRKNQNWEEVLAIRDQLGKEVPNLLFLVSPTVNIFNVLHLPDFHREWVSLGYLGPFDLIPSILRQPAHYAIGILPATIKRKAQAHIAAHLEWLSAQPAKELAQKEFAMNQWRGISNRLVGEGNAAQLREFKSRTQKLDQLRGEKFVEIFPELASLLD